jgi:hypothetical protein
LDIFFKLLKLVPLVQEINRKHSEALNTVKMRQPTSTPNCTPQQPNSNIISNHGNPNTNTNGMNNTNINQSNFNSLNLKMNKAT